MPNQNQTRRERVQRMLQRKKPTLTRQEGRRNLFNTRRNSRNSQYSGLNTNENNLRNYITRESNVSNELNLNSGFSNTFSPENQYYLNMYIKNLQNRNNAEKAYRQRKTMSGRWNRFKQRMRNRSPTTTRRFRFPTRRTPPREIPASMYINMI